MKEEKALTNIVMIFRQVRREGEERRERERRENGRKEERRKREEGRVKERK